MTELLQNTFLHIVLGFIAFGITIQGVVQQVRLTYALKTTKGVSKPEVMKRLIASSIITVSLAITTHPLFWGSLAMTLVMVVYSQAVWKYRDQ